EHAEFLSISFSAPDKELQLELKLDQIKRGSSEFYDDMNHMSGSFGLGYYDPFNDYGESYKNREPSLTETVLTVNALKTNATIPLFLEIAFLFSKIICKKYKSCDGYESKYETMMSNLTPLFQFFGIDGPAWDFIYKPSMGQITCSTDILHNPRYYLNSSTFLQPVNDNMSRNYGFVFSELKATYGKSKFMFRSYCDLNEFPDSNKEVLKISDTVNFSMPKIMKMIIAEKNNIPVFTDIKLSRLNEPGYMESISSDVSDYTRNNLFLEAKKHYYVFSAHINYDNIFKHSSEQLNYDNKPLKYNSKSNCCQIM
ncbi:MAG: hypothetical protein GY730_06810, partial [bacterium]|nr:hypothetical protein [bacterium]